jgi:hypothetical protein
MPRFIHELPPHLPASTVMHVLVTRIVFVVAFVVSVIWLPLMTEDEGLRALLPPMLILLFLQLAPAFLSARPDLFDPAVFSGVFVSMSTISVIALFYSKDGITLRLVQGLDPMQEADLAYRVVVLSCVAQLCYYVAYYHPRWGRAASELMPKLDGLSWDRRRLLLVTFVCLGVFGVTYAVFQARVGGSMFDITRLSEGKSVWRDDPTMSWMMRGIQVGFLPVFLLLTHLAADKPLGKPHLRAVAALAVGSGLVAILVLRLGQRGIVASAGLAAVIIVHYLWRRIPVTVFVAILFFGMTLSNLLLPYRERYLIAPTEGPTAVEMAGDPAGVLADHEAERQRFSALALVVHSFPEEHDYLLGRSWLAMVALPIPRWLWPEKGNHFVWRDTRIVMNLSGAPVPSTYLGALWANFSWFGVILGMIGWGIIQRAFYVWFRRNPTDRTVVLLYATLLTFFGLTMLQMGNVVQYVIPIWLIVRFVARRPRHAPV